MFTLTVVPIDYGIREEDGAKGMCVGGVGGGKMGIGMGSQNLPSDGACN